jgi:hypothetical protein
MWYYVGKLDLDSVEARDSWVVYKMLGIVSDSSRIRMWVLIILCITGVISLLYLVASRLLLRWRLELVW